MAKYEAGTYVNLVAPNASSDLADGALLAISYDNSGADDLWFWANVQLTMKFKTSAPAARIIIAELYLLPTVTDVPEGDDGTDTPQDALLVGTFQTINPHITTTEFLALPAISLPPAVMNFVIKNVSGETFVAAVPEGATGWGLRILPFRTQK